MKNIHIIPTNKPSVLILRQDGKLFFTGYGGQLGNIHGLKKDVPQNIYITNSEEPKLDEWGINLHNNVIFNCKGFDSTEETKKYHRKIILTNDQDLIVDGVQSVNGEFLEWFVKNLTCERVEVKKKYSDFTVDPFVGYEIIIPKEEPKPFLDDSAFSLPDFNLSKNVFDKMSSLDNVKKTPKTETLKEAVDRLCYADQSMFVMGVNWQKERSFSKEEVLNIANWAFHFYKRNDLSDSELEEEFEKLLNETLTKK
jgi:hypothetical protein